MTHNERGTARDPESVRLGDGDLRDNQEEIVRRVTEYAAALHTETITKFEAVTQQLGTLATSEQATGIIGQLGTLAGSLAEIEARRAQDKTEILGAVGQVGLDLADVAEATANALDGLEQRRADDRAALDQYAATIIGKLDQLLGGEPTWRETKDLIDPKFRPVLGVHTGGGSSFTRIQEALGHPIQVAPIYWKTYESPLDPCLTKLRNGTIPRLELCLPHIFSSASGGRVEMNGTYWKRAGNGEFDDRIRWLLTPLAGLDQPIFLSTGHESDYRSEDGASPKNDDPPRETWCGPFSDFPAYWQRFAELAREICPQHQLFLNWGGGYSGVPERWSEMLPPAGTFDFFGYDFYSMYGKIPGAPWDSFEQRLKMFGRWDWYKENLPDVPMIVGETGVCAHENPTDRQNAGRWLLDAVDFMCENRWQGVGTGGGISQVWIFSHHYDEHPRCLDDNGTHKGCDSGQRYAVLPQIGADPRLAWSA